MIELRTAVVSEAEELARIYTDSWNLGFGDLMGYRTTTSERLERWRRDLDDPTVRWSVAELDGSIAGFSGIGASRDPLDPSIGELQTIAVDPQSWRRGVGRALMVDAIARLGSTYDSAVLWTVTGYERGHAFYRAMGWTPLGWLRNGGVETAFAHTLRPGI